MPSASEHADIVLAGIIPKRFDLLEKVFADLTEDHFPERTQKVMFRLLDWYYQKVQNVLTRAAVEDRFRDNKNVGTSELFLATYDKLEATKVIDQAFFWSLDQLKEIYAQDQTKLAIKEGLEKLTQGEPGEGYESVHEEARATILEAFSVVDRALVGESAPEGDVRGETADFLADYQKSKELAASGKNLGIQFGISNLDEKIGGIQPGELALSVGYSSDGKTTLCTQLAWSTAVEQQKNVVFLTTETNRATVFRKLIARHSVLPQFQLNDGLNTRDMKKGSLTQYEEQRLPDVLNDFKNNPAYGRIYIAQVPRGATLDYCEAVLNRAARQFDVDLCVMDYLALLRSNKKRGTEREELASVLKDGKQVAHSAFRGKGVPFVSPWQVSRAAKENAEKVGIYTSQALSETAEATNSADLIVSLLAPTDNTARRADLMMQVIKNRDGETANSLPVTVDYATSYFKTQAGLGALSQAAAPSSQGGLGALLSDY